MSQMPWTNTRVTRALGIALPIVQGPFGGGLSSVALAAAVSNAGGLGSFGAHLIEPARMGALVSEIRALTDRPFAINLWVPQAAEPRTIDDGAFARAVQLLRPHLRELDVPEPSAPAAYLPDFASQLAAALDARPPVISFVMDAPPASAIAEARGRGIRTIATATTVDEAIALDHAGVDLIVASGSDAGGHRGAFLKPVRESLVGTFSLVPQVADAVRAPVIAAGGIADGRGIAAALTLGADAVQIGTAFLACDESNASAAHRAALLGPRARSTMLTRAFSGRTARTIVNAFALEMEAHDAEIPVYPVQNWLTQPMRRAAGAIGDTEHLSLWAGQSAPLARGGKAEDLVARLLDETGRAFRPA